MASAASGDLDEQGPVGSAGSEWALVRTVPEVRELKRTRSAGHRIE